MTQKTEQFKTSQKAKWRNGLAADENNFSQLFDAIADLIDASKTEAITEATAAHTPADTYTDDKAKAATKAVLNDANESTGFKATQLYRDVNTKNTALESRLSTLEASNSGYFSYTNNNLVLSFNSANETVSISSGSQLLTAADTDLLAEKVNKSGTLIVLTRHDGARLLYNKSTGTLEPAKSLIG